MKTYHPRNLELKLSKLLKAFSVITITGPRQAGKSTLLKHFISKQKNKWEYFSLDERELLLEVRSDPALFMKSIKGNVVIDEVQKAPDLFNYIKILVDEDFPYKIILSGSANFLLLKNITESLAGRTGILELLPFSFSEAYLFKSNSLIENIVSHENIENLYQKLSKKNIEEEKLLNFILNGGYPKLYQNQNIDKDTLHKSYITTYIERDLRDLSQIANLDTFQKVYKLLSYQSASIVNMSNLSSDIGIDAKTIKNYASILETSYICKFINPYSFNPKKRLIKSPKLFFFDTGLLNHFYGNDNLEMLLNRAHWGGLLETFVFSEIYKEIKDLTSRVLLYFYRTSNGAEVDFVIEKGSNLYPIEVKSSVKIESQDTRGIKSFIETYSKKVPYGIIFYRGERTKFIDKNILCIPLQMLF